MTNLLELRGVALGEKSAFSAVVDTVAKSRGRDPDLDITLVANRIDESFFKSTFYATRYRVGNIGKGVDLRLNEPSGKRQAEAQTYEADRELSEDEVNMLIDTFAQVLRDVFGEYLKAVGETTNVELAANSQAAFVARQVANVLGMNGESMAGFSQPQKVPLVVPSYDFAQKLKMSSN